MATTRLLQAACAAAILAAMPAFAQTNTETGSTGTGGMPKNPTAHETMPNTMPGHKSMGSHAGMEDHMTHRSAMTHTGSELRRGAGQSAAVDQLNEQSYQAARNGQGFNGTNATGTMAPSGSGSMNDTSGGSMSGSSPK